MPGRASPASGDSNDLKTFWAGSIYGVKTRRGLVELAEEDAEGHRTWATQITPTEARAIALSILEAAEAAESDQIFVEFLQQKIQLPLEHAAQVLPVLRELRDRLS